MIESLRESIQRRLEPDLTLLLDAPVSVSFARITERQADHFEREAADGALFVGSPRTVAAKIVQTVKDLGLSRFDLKYANGTLPHDRLLNSIELYGTKVAPIVRDRLAN